MNFLSHPTLQPQRPVPTGWGGKSDFLWMVEVVRLINNRGEMNIHEETSLVWEDVEHLTKWHLMAAVGDLVQEEV